MTASILPIQKPQRSPVLVARDVGPLGDHGHAVERAAAAVEHKLRLFDNFPQPHTAVTATAGHGAFPVQAVNRKNRLLVSKQRLDVHQLVQVPELQARERVGGGVFESVDTMPGK